MELKIQRLNKLTNKQLLEIEKSEREVFKEGGLNRWTLPVISRYGQLFAAKENGKILGLASFILKEKTAFLIGLWVKEDFQNQGIGQKILNKAIVTLKAQDIKSLELTVDGNNEAAYRLYQKMGFEFIKKLDDFYGPNEGRVLLKRNLLQ